jgi:hypothetical protein
MDILTNLLLGVSNLGNTRKLSVPQVRKPQRPELLIKAKLPHPQFFPLGQICLRNIAESAPTSTKFGPQGVRTENALPGRISDRTFHLRAGPGDD